MLLYMKSIKFYEGGKKTVFGKQRIEQQQVLDTAI